MGAVISSSETALREPVTMYGLHNNPVSGWSGWIRAYLFVFFINPLEEPRIVEVGGFSSNRSHDTNNNVALTISFIEHVRPSRDAAAGVIGAVQSLDL